MFETLGHYKILDRIGAGGMGELYRARDTRLGRTVAIRVIVDAVAGDPQRRERFLREARATAALSHPNIAALYEVGEDQDPLFLVFEYVPGKTLKNLIAGRPLNPRRAIDLAVQIADALADAHAEGIVHRDISADNILVTPKGNAKVLDFGLAKWTTGGAERDQAATPQTDIFSLGIVLFEMLTGRLPFTGTASPALAPQPAPVPSAVDSRLPAELDAIVGKALAQSIERQYASAATLAAELRTVGAILDVRSDTQAAASASSPVRPGRGSGVGWVLLLVLLAVFGTAAWYTRASIQRIWRSSIGSPPPPVIAIIPFETDPSQTFFADGLAEDLTTRLGQTPGLKVIGRSAARQNRGRTPQDVAHELGAAVVLVGSVRPAADSVTMTLELIDPVDGTAIWSQRYTREAKDIFALQAQVAEQVAAALHVKPQPSGASARAASRLIDPRAYETYLRARQAIDERRLDAAMRLYQDAIAADAGLAEAHAGLAIAMHLDMVMKGDARERPRLDRIQAAAERAYQLDPDLPQANVALGLTAASFSQMLQYLRHAVDVDPSYGDGYHQIAAQVGEFDPPLALGFWRKSLDVDPRLEINHVDLAGMLTYLNRWDEARQALARVTGDRFASRKELFGAFIDLDEHRFEPALKAMSINPLLRQAEPVWSAYIVALATAGKIDEALAEAERGVRRFPDSCVTRSALAGLSRDRKKAGAARVAEPLLSAAASEAASPAAVRCAVTMAAAMNDAPRMAALLDRIAAGEDLLRFWARPIDGITGGMLMRGRQYPFDGMVTRPAVAAASRRLDEAHRRLGEVAREALKGLP
jgi:TolB-like protein